MESLSLHLYTQCKLLATAATVNPYACMHALDKIANANKIHIDNVRLWLQMTRKFTQRNLGFMV